MRSEFLSCALALSLITCSYTHAHAGDPAEPATTKPHFLARIRPAGGCNPDGRGLFHWWNPHCFPRPCGPDLYCRKPMPNVCRPRTPFAPPYVPQQPALPPRPTSP
jgi:hypothetical protein